MDQQAFQVQVFDFFRIFQEDIRMIKEEVRGLKGEIQGVKTEIQGIKAEISDLRQELKADIKELRDEQRADRKKLDEVYQSRNIVKIKFGLGWSLLSLLIAIVASGITQVFGD